MSERPGRTFLLSLLGYVVVACVFFGRSFPSDQIFVPMHTHRLEPWRSDLSPERTAELKRGEVASASDTLISFRADDQATIDALREGRVPLWNETNAGGVPHLAQALYGVFYPFHVIYRWMEPERAYGFLAALQHLLAALFTFLLLRQVGAGGFGAFVGGLAFGFSTYFMMRAHYYQYVGTYAWLPLGLYFVERWFTSRSIVWLGLLSLTAGVVLLAAWPQTGGYTIYAWILWAVVRAARADLALPRTKLIGAGLAVLAAAAAISLVANEEGKLITMAFAPWIALLLAFAFAGGKRAFLGRMAWLGAALFVGALIAMIQYLPSVEWMAWANRRALGAPEAYVASGLRPTFLLDLALPWLFGRPDFAYLDSLYNLPRLLALTPADLVAGLGDRIGNLIENTVFFGLVPLALVPIGLIVPSVRRGALTLIAFLFGAFAVGVPYVVYPLYFGGLCVGGDPRRALGVFVFAACALAGLGAGAVARREKPALVTAGVLGVVLVVVSFVGGVGLSQSVLKHDRTIEPLVENAHTMARELGLPEHVPEDAKRANSKLVDDTITRACLVGLLSGIALLTLLTRARPWLRFGPVIVVLAVDLATAAWPSIVPKPRDGFLESHPIIEQARRDVGRTGRIFRYCGDDTGLSLTHAVVPPNLAGCYGLLDANCYTVSPPRRFGDLAERLAPKEDELPDPKSIAPADRATRRLYDWFHHLDGSVFIPYLPDPEALGSRVLDLMAVKAILGFGAVPEPLPDGISITHRGKSSFVLKNDRALPRVFAVSRSEDVTRWTEEQTLDQLMSPAFDPRREVLLEGEGAETRRADGTPPSVTLEVDEAEHLVARLEGGDGACVLVIVDSYAPGFVATVDGNPAPVVVANFAFRAVPLPAGAETVEVRYDPAGFRRGRALTYVGLAAALFAILAGIARRRRGPGAIPSPPSSSPPSSPPASPPSAGPSNPSAR